MDEGINMRKRKDSFLASLASKLNTDDVFWANEVRANLFVASAMVATIVILVILIILRFCGVFNFSDQIVIVVLREILVILVIPVVLCMIFKGQKKWLKFVMIAGMLLLCARLLTMVSSIIMLFMVIPTIVSVAYYSRKVTIITAISTVGLMVPTTYFGVMYGWLNMSAVQFPVGTIIKILPNSNGFIFNSIQQTSLNADRTQFLKSTFINSFVPNIIIFIMIAILCEELAERGRAMVETQANIVKSNARIQTELNLAQDIQDNMLPSIFPPFPDHDEFDLYATMEPAKEVGGDFYDMFMLDNVNLCLVVGDVSGKGVPAALIMVITKTLIKNYAQMNLTPQEVFSRVNAVLCENNEAGLFITAWMAVLNTNTGELTFVNAGHNPPLIKTSDGKVNFLYSKPGFVLAGMDSLIYAENHIKLNPGDELFLYTDGVTEATNAKCELYEESRLKNYFINDKYTSSKETVEGLREDIGKFIEDEEQFDDITMLHMRFNKYSDRVCMTTKNFIARVENLPKVNLFLETELSEYNFSVKEQMALQLVVEELFTNVSSYSYGSNDGSITISIGFNKKEDTLIIMLVDKGMPFNPLEKEDPDIHKPVEERSAGGLGIYMVKEYSDKITYKYENGENIVVIYKKRSE